MAYFGRGFYLPHPSELLSTDWFVFLVVFGITYAASYFSLSKVFYNKKHLGLEDIVLSGKKYKHVTSSVANVISICIGLIVAAAATRADILNVYIGDYFTGVILAVVGLLLLLMLVPFYKAIVVNVGVVPGTLLAILFVWAALKFGFAYTDVIYYVSFEVQEIVEAVTSAGVLIGALIVGGILSNVFKKQILKSAIRTMRRKK
jgi:hypothetical protein